MFRIFHWLILGTTLATLAVPRTDRAKTAVGDKTVVKPEGVYEFVSESTVLMEPRQAESMRTSSEWGGEWQFREGHYSRILMKRKRESFFNSNGIENLGFEASAGSFEVKDQSLILSETYALNPFEVGNPRVLLYRVNGDYLTLIERLYPHVEDMREGTVTTNLRRVR